MEPGFSQQDEEGRAEALHMRLKQNSAPTKTVKPVRG